MTETRRRFACWDLIRAHPSEWAVYCELVGVGDPKSPPIGIVLEGDAGDGMILYLDNLEPNRIGRASVEFYVLLEDSTDYQVSREVKAHVLCCGLLELAEKDARKRGDFEGATWLAEQTHQVDMHNYWFCRFLIPRYYETSRIFGG